MEIHENIVCNLTFPITAFLRGAYRYFRELVLPSTLTNLLEFKNKQLSNDRPLYTYSICLRLRHRSKFIDD